MQSFLSNIPKEDINKLDLFRFDGKIILVNDKQDLKNIFEEIKQFDIVGFDTESKPAFKKGVYNPIALIQISTVVKTYLIRINKTGITECIIDFIENENIKKIGIGLTEDVRDLIKLGIPTPKGFVQLNDLVKQINIESNGLRPLAAIILGIRISKSAQVTNWEADKLTEKQIIYAATDSWAPIEMYQKLKTLNLIQI